MNRFIMLLRVVILLSVANALHAAPPSIDEVRKNLASSDYKMRQWAANELYNLGKEVRPLKKEEVDLLLPHLKSDPEWRVKMKIACALAYSEKPEWVLEPLIAALQDRDDESSGSGNVPGAASISLAILGDTRALPAVREWLKYLKTHPDAPIIRDMSIKIAEGSVAKLEKKLNEEKKIKHKQKGEKGDKQKGEKGDLGSERH